MTSLTAPTADRFHWIRWALPAAALLSIGAVWLSTLQTEFGAQYPPSFDVEGTSGALMDDSGEFVVAWSRWGVTHPPGYPLLNLIGNLITAVLRLVGTDPLIAANLVSYVFSLAAVILAALYVLHKDGSGAGAAAAMLLPAFGVMTWLFAGAAEAYPLALALGLGCLLLALHTGDNPTRGRVLALGGLFGLAVVHHRLLLVLAPALALAAWPALRLGWRTWLLAALLAVSALLVYLYLPLSAAVKSPWIYGRSPATWEGILDAALAREYSEQIVPETAPADILSNLIGRIDYLGREITLPAVALGAAGLAVALADRSTRRPASVIALVIGAYWLAPVGQYLLIGTHLLVMFTCFALGIGLGLGIAALSRRSALAGYAALGLVAAVSIRANLINRPTVLVYADDSAGQQIIDAVEALNADAPVVVEVWGPRYSALAYGKWVSGELADIQLVDARSELAGLPPADTLPDTIYTTQDLLYAVPPDQWEARLGYAIRLESAGDRLVAIRPALQESGSDQLPADFPISVQEAAAWRDGNDIRIVVVWEAAARPQTDYHVFAHVTAQPEISAPDDILAQGDRDHPVYGFYPTSRWAAGETIRDDYRIPLPNACLRSDACQPRYVRIGLYTVEPDGAFVNHLVEVIDIGQTDSR